MNQTAAMSRWVKTYIVISAIALLGCAGAFAFIFLVSKSQHSESPAIVENIFVSGRVVSGKDLNAYLNLAPLENQKRPPESALYLVARLSYSKLSGHLLSASAEFESPAFMKGRKISVNRGLVDGPTFHITPLGSSSLTDEQRNILLTTTPKLRAVDAWTK